MRGGWSARSSTEADAITLGCLVENIDQELRELDSRLIEHDVSAMPFTGPAVLLATAARTVVADEQAAADYLERLRRSGEWMDQQTERLRIGAAKGRLPGSAARGAGDRLGARRPAAGGSRGAGRAATRRWLGRIRRLARAAGRAGGRGGEASAGTMGRAAARADAARTLGRRAGPRPHPGRRGRLRELRPVGDDSADGAGRDSPDRPGGDSGARAPRPRAWQRTRTRLAGGRPSGIALVGRKPSWSGRDPGRDRGYPPRRGARRRVLPRAATSAVRGDCDADGGRLERDAPSLHAAEA